MPFVVEDRDLCLLSTDDAADTVHASCVPATNLAHYHAIRGGKWHLFACTGIGQLRIIREGVKDAHTRTHKQHYLLLPHHASCENGH